jgi:pyruvate/2-oxoglutarate dehydrogenase complex dihydrolipoamide dehydrogenase (E3) component
MRIFPGRRFEEILQCIGCCRGCLQNILEKDAPVACSINPFAGREAEAQLVIPSIKKKLLVLGGGPAGLQTAITASEMGHQVVLLENSELGGQLCLAAKTPGKEVISQYVHYLTKTIGRLNVQVMKTVTIDEKLINEIKPDAVVIAVGSREKNLDIPGVDKNRVVSARYVLRTDITAEKVAIIGGGQVGCEVAEYFSCQGKQVTIIEVTEEVAREMDRINRVAMLSALDEGKVNILTNASALSITDEGIWANHLGEKKFIPADLIVVSVGAEANITDAERIAVDKISERYYIGDRVCPGGILEAVHSGFDAARRL